MKFVTVPGIPILNTAPLAEIRVKGWRISVFLDDSNGKRFEIAFDTYQAMRLITEDCYLVPEDVSFSRRTIVEVLNSNWIDELKANLSSVDIDANFLDRSRHFILPLGDSFLEVVAWTLIMPDE